MTTNMLSYSGGFVNQETNRPDNQPNQQLVEMRIYDQEAPVTDNPFGIRYKVTNNYDGFVKVDVSWDALPEATVAAAFGWYDGTNWNDQAVDPLSGSATLYFVDTATDSWGFFVDYAVGFDTRVQLSNVPPIEVELTDTPLITEVIDNDENKFTPIRSKQATIGLYSSGQMDIANFCDGGDNRFVVEIDYPYTQFAAFRGFLSLSDLQQDFQPDPNTITLIATDGLGFLNDEVLVTFDGLNPLNDHPIMDYLCWSLGRTGQRLEIDVIMNLRDPEAPTLDTADGAAGHFYKWFWLDAKTFEDEIGLSTDAYEVLIRILGNMCFLTQYKGRWRIQRIDEMELDKPLNVYRFNSEGGFIDKRTENVQKQIGYNLPLSWMNDDAVKSAQRPYKSINLDFNYDFPEELICNIDLSRGTFDPVDVDYTGTVDIIPECIEFLRESSPSRIDTLDQPASGGATGVLKRMYEGGQEKENYLLGDINDGFRHYFKFQQLAVGVNDKIEFSFNFRLISPSSVTNYFPLLVLLYGNDGTYWAWNYDQPTGVSEWVQLLASDTPFNDLWRSDLSGLDPTEWQGISATSRPIPVSGNLVFRFLVTNTTYSTAFADLSMRYIIYLNGSYPDYSGQRDSVVDVALRPKAVLKEQVYISDGPALAMKGVLKVPTMDGFKLGSLVYNAARSTDAVLNPMRFGRQQSFDVWNQFNRVMMQFEGTVDGMDSGAEIPDIVHTYVLTDADKSTINRLFMILHYSQDHHLCEFNLFLQELQDSTKPKVYDNHEFKYVTANE